MRLTANSYCMHASQTIQSYLAMLSRMACELCCHWSVCDRKALHDSLGAADALRLTFKLHQQSMHHSPANGWWQAVITCLPQLVA